MDMEILRILKKPSNQPGSFLEITFTDTFSEKVKLLMPRKLIENKAKIKDYLLDNSFPNQDTNGWEAVFKILQAKEPTNNFGMLVNKTGFWNRGYLLPDGKFIGPEEKYTLLLEPGTAKYIPNCSVSGLLDDWKNTIALSALNSSRIMLAICGGPLSGFLLGITGVESGGFHFGGKSSIGKTTIMRCSLSTSGPDTNMQSWNFTEAAVEEIAYAHSDGHICFDELKAAHPDPKTAANITTSAIYKLSLEKGRATSSKYAAEQYTWKIVILSTGEDSLAVHAEKGGTKRKLGEEVRMIDIPADAGQGLGIFEILPKEFVNASDYAKYLAEQVQQYYGTAQEAFLEKLIAEINEENAEQTVKDQLDEWMEKFRSKCGVDQESGVDVRFANRFALACAAGCLAVKYGVLPFTRQEVFESISACYKAALFVKPKSWEDQITRFDEKLAEYLGSNEFLALDSQESWSKKEIKKNDGFSQTINGIQLVALKPDIVRSLIPEFYLKDVLNDCKSEGYLLPGADGSNTRSIALNDKKVRHYCFVWPRDKSNIAAAKKLIKGYSMKMKQNNEE